MRIDLDLNLLHKSVSPPVASQAIVFLRFCSFDSLVFFLASRSWTWRKPGKMQQRSKLQPRLWTCWPRPWSYSCCLRIWLLNRRAGLPVGLGEQKGPRFCCWIPLVCRGFWRFWYPLDIHQWHRDTRDPNEAWREETSILCQSCKVGRGKKGNTCIVVDHQLFFFLLSAFAGVTRFASTTDLDACWDWTNTSCSE